MKDYEKLLIQVINEYVDDYGIEALFEELNLGSAGEVINDMYNSGLIPDDTMEKFINE
jgi:hypothetical protein